VQTSCGSQQFCRLFSHCSLYHLLVVAVIVNTAVHISIEVHAVCVLCCIYYLLFLLHCTKSCGSCQHFVA
jgi:hypothetical protein